MAEVQIIQDEKHAPLLEKLSQPSAAKVIKAQDLLGTELRDITAYSKVYASQDMAAVIAAIDADAAPCARGEAATLTAMLIGKSRMSGMPNGPIGDDDMKVYSLGLFEAFSKFPLTIGLQAIDGGTGIPAQTPFWPKPHDVVKFCQALMQKRATAKIMAQRHMTEAKRREAELAEKQNTKPVDYEARRRRVAEILGPEKLQQMDDVA